jgi:hypothetical protein
MMKKPTLLSGLLGAIFIAGLAIAPAHAQATRTWVSGVGDDANPCSRTAPCKTWPGAISKTATGGEIDALDPGGFGTVTITKSITLDGGGGIVASILASGAPGVTVNAAGGVVILRNLRINGIVQSVSPGTIGVNIVSAARVEFENDDIFGFGNATGQGGIVIAPTSGTVNVGVQNTSIYDSQAGILSKPTGGAIVNLTVEHSYIDNNLGGGIRLDGTLGSGTTNAAIADSSMSLNNGNGMLAIAGLGNIKADLMRDVIANNISSGVQSNNSAGSTAVVTVGESILSNNVVGAWNIAGSATLLSYHNNQVTGPTGSTPGTATPQ